MKITISVTLNYAELSAAAQQRAVEIVQDKIIGGAWWDSTDTESIGETILYVLAENLRTPGWDTFGSGDFPGIPQVKITGWDVERGGTLDVDGTLTPEAAPALPWPEDCAYLRLGRTEANWSGRHRGVWIAETDEYVQSSADDDRADVQALYAAWDAAVAAALAAGAREIEYKHSEEYAREWLDINADGMQFTEDGELA